MTKRQAIFLTLSTVFTLTFSIEEAFATPASLTNVYVSKTGTSSVSGTYVPSSGVYLGVLVADDPTEQLASQNGNTEQPANSVNDGSLLPYFGQVYGKQAALYLTYKNFGEPFPTNFASSAKSLGGGIQIGWQPEEVINGKTESLSYLFSSSELAATNAYIKQFVDDAKVSGVPVFLRFASEMNDNWTSWSGNPTQYVQAWQDVYNIIQQEGATNVKMVWSPDAITASDSDEQNVLSYYPGNQYVDWIGESVYIFPYNYFWKEDQLNASIIDLFSPLYNLMETSTYGDKPFMISEGGVVSKMPDPWQPSTSSTPVLSPNDPSLHSFPDFGVTELSQFLNIIPKQYPNVKAITYFNESIEAANNSIGDRNLTYDVYDVTGMQSAFENIIKDPFFLSSINANSNGLSYFPLQSAGNLMGIHTVSPEIALSNGELPAKVEVIQGASVLASSTSAPWNMDVDFSNVDPNEPLLIEAFDASGNVIGEGSNTLYSKWISVDQHTDLYNSENGTDSGYAIDPQPVFAYTKDGNWYEIQTSVGTKWINVPYINEQYTTTQYYSLYDSPSFSTNIVGGVSAQTVNVLQQSGNWLQIHTYMGPEWIFVPSLSNQLSIPNQVTLYEQNNFTSATSGIIQPQTVTVLQQNGDWYQINTYLGPKWIYLGSQISLSEHYPLYASSSLGSGIIGAVSPQTVNIVKQSGDWMQIKTYLGNEWIYLGSQLSLSQRESLYTAEDPSTNYSGSISPQTVNILKVDGPWYEIQTYLGPQWIYNPQ